MLTVEEALTILQELEADGLGDCLLGINTSQGYYRTITKDSLFAVQLYKAHLKDELIEPPF